MVCELRLLVEVIVRGIFAVLTMLGSLTGCMSTASNEQAREAYRERLRVWFGASERELVAHWGPPTSVYQVSGDRHLTYWSSRLESIPGPRGWYWFDATCQLTFSIEGGVVAAWRFQGSGCY
jgi:hypothetical protein